MAQPGRISRRRVRRVPGRRPEGRVAGRLVGRDSTARRSAVERSGGRRAHLRPRPRGRVEATLHRETLARAGVMMSSEQLKAFDVSQEPAARPGRVRRYAVRARLPGRPAADRGRRALRRGHPGRLGCACHQPRNPSRAGQGPRPGVRRAVAQTCRERKLLDRTIVVCCGEFGRTPKINLDRRPRPLASRLQPRAGRRRDPRRQALGETDPEGVEGTRSGRLRSKTCTRPCWRPWASTRPRRTSPPRRAGRSSSAPASRSANWCLRQVERGSDVLDIGTFAHERAGRRHLATEDGTRFTNTRLQFAEPIVLHGNSFSMIDRSVSSCSGVRSSRSFLG